MTYLFLKQRIPMELEDGPYYDIVTPYGYGGPRICALSDPAEKENLLRRFEADFADYAKRERLVSEFIRFHPVLENALDFKNHCAVEFNRHTVGTNLTYPDVLGTEVNRKSRKQMRHILKNPDISYQFDEHPTSLDEFLEVYYSTMRRDEASEEYYFPRQYFQEILSGLPEHLLTVKVCLKDKVIAMGLYFRYGTLLHAHLSGTLSEYLSYSPAYLLRYALITYGMENHYRLIHYGGGKTAAPDDSLYRFKKKFGQTTEFDFYIGKKIWNEPVYSRLCAMRGYDSRNPADSFFPLYRKNTGHGVS